MNKIILLGLIISLIIVSCTDPNILGLEVQPPSDNIIINDTSAFNWQNSQTEAVDSTPSTKLINFVLGEITDPIFGYNSGSFYTQILLSENNNSLGDNPQVDSVILSYTYSGFYGELEEFSNLEVNKINEDLYEDSTYYSTSFEIIPTADWIDTFSLSNNSEIPFLKIKLNNNFGQEILDLGDENLKDNETFLQQFKGINVLASSLNTILYLNPEGANSYLKIYYHNDESGTDTLSLDFDLGGDAVRVSLFNKKSANTENSTIINDQNNIYIQSMAGYKSKISIINKDSIKSLLKGKAINKVTMSFTLALDSKTEYDAHEKLFLVRVNNNGDNVFLTDLTLEGEVHFGGRLENDKYEFNITRYFYQLLNNELYTNDLYLLPAGDAINANRTILNKNIKLQIYYSEL